VRRLLAWILLAAGLACGIAGALLLTAFAPSDRITVTQRAEDPGIAVVSAPGLLELSGPDVRLRATAAGGDDVFLAVARADDVTAWLGDAAHTEVTGVGGDLGDPEAVSTTAGSGAAADPRAADVWLSTASTPGSAELTWATASDGEFADAGGVVVFAATDGTSAAPQQLSFSWAAQGRAATHPSGVPLVVAGCVLALVGALGVLLAPRTTRPKARRRA
jgi:hypothetical protein